MAIFHRHEYPGEAIQTELGDRAMNELCRENYSLSSRQRRWAIEDRCEERYQTDPGETI